MVKASSFNAAASLTQGLLRKLIEDNFGPNTSTHYRDADIADNNGDAELVLTKDYNGKKETKRVKLDDLDDITNGSIREINAFF